MLLTLIWPFVSVLRFFPLFEMASAVFLLVTVWEYLLESRSAVLLPLAGLLVLTGASGLAVICSHEGQEPLTAGG